MQQRPRRGEVAKRIEGYSGTRGTGGGRLLPPEWVERATEFWGADGGAVAEDPVLLVDL